MSTLSITIKSARTQADLQSRYKPHASNPREAAVALATLLRALASGNENGSVRVATGASNPVGASGTATITYASLAANDTITIAGVTLTCVASGATNVQFNKQTDAEVTAANLAAAINALPTLNIYVSAAASAGGVVTITSVHTGITSNFIPLAKSSSGIAISGATLAGGTGTNEAATTYALGL